MIGSITSLAPFAVELLAHDLRELLHDAPHQRGERVDAGGDLHDEAPAREQLVARDLRIGGVFAQGRDQDLAEAHRAEQSSERGRRAKRCGLAGRPLAKIAGEGTRTRFPSTMLGDPYSKEARCAPPLPCWCSPVSRQEHGSSSTAARSNRR
jgi:hypothetical protein